GRGREGCDRARRRLPGQPRAAPARGLRRRRNGPRVGARAAAAAAPAPARRCRLDDRLGLPGALPGTARPAHLDDADQGHAPGRGGRRVGEGLGGARDDRRPRAQRPLTGLRARVGALARADGATRAGRGHAPRLDRRREAARGRRPRRDPRCDLPGWLDHRCAEDLGDRPRRRARAGRPGRVDGRARHRLPERRLRPGADDPHVRGRRGRDPPLGRRRGRLGLRPAGGDRGILGQGAAAARRGRRAGPRVIVAAIAVAGRGLVDPAEPVFFADDEAVLRGTAGFETLRVYGGRPFRLDAHLDRLAGSIARLGLPPVDRQECAELARDAVRAAGGGGLALRYYRTYRTLVVTVGPLPEELDDERARGLRLRTVRIDFDPLLRGVKSTSYAFNMAARQDAERAGDDDALFVSSDGVVLEGTTANVWWREGGELFTLA